MNISQEHNYQHALQSLKDKIRQARQQAIVAVNSQLLLVYWEIGQVILQQQHEEGWGARIIDKLAADLKFEFPDLKGLSVRNLKYMRAFSAAYPDVATIVQSPIAQIDRDENSAAAIVQSPIAQISWTHHIKLLDKVADAEERTFYIQKTVENGWSVAVLTHQIATGLYRRQGSAVTNFKSTLPVTQSDLAQQMLKNPYIFDFVGLTEEMKERDVERALIAHLKKFLLELGRGFAYVGNQYNLGVGDQDYFLDLLFYNYHLHCFVIFELKVGDFKPEFAGKLNFYTNAIDEQVRGGEDKPTIGVLLCKSANETIVKYALKGIDSPLGVAEYQLASALPQDLKSELPSIEELEKELEAEYESLKSPAEKRMDALKERIAGISNKEVQIFGSTELIEQAFHQGVRTLYAQLIERLDFLKADFLRVTTTWQGSDGAAESLDELTDEWLRENKWFNFGIHHFYYRYWGFKKGGTEPFDLSISLDWVVERMWYGFRIVNHKNQELFSKRLYHESLSQQDIVAVCDEASGYVADQMEFGLSRLEQKQ